MNKYVKKLTKKEKLIYDRYLSGECFKWDSPEHHLLFLTMVKRVKVTK